MTRNQYAGLIAVLLLFGWFGWPTPYYTRLIKGNTIRTHRLTGCMAVDTPGGWQNLSMTMESCQSPEERQQKAEQAAQEAKYAAEKKTFAPLYKAGQEKIVQAMYSNATAIYNRGFFNVKAYNPTDCKLSSLTIFAGGRDYTQTTYNDGQPRTSFQVEFEVFNGDSTDFDGWYVKGVEYETPGTMDGDPSCAASITPAGG